MQGFNMGRYVPPDLEGVMSANQASGKGHALGARANKLSSQGILTVRFEMPYAVWCHGCAKPTIIAQGVRFNAEKKKVGNYFSTPIWSFGIKHAACGQKLEIRTDPQNTAYVVVSGGKARDHGPVVREGEEGVEILSAEERERRREDAFAALEGRQEEKVAEKDNKRRIEELLDEREKGWSDPYELNRALRRGFRAERKVMIKDGLKTDAIKDRFALGIELVPEAVEDGQRAAVIDFGHFEPDTNLNAVSKPLFNDVRKEATPFPKKTTIGNRVVKRTRDQKTTLQSALRDNTRAGLDLFGDAHSQRDSSSGIKVLAKGTQNGRIKKSARTTESSAEEMKKMEQPSRQPFEPPGLVDYESE